MSFVSRAKVGGLVSQFEALAKENAPVTPSIASASSSSVVRTTQVATEVVASQAASSSSPAEASRPVPLVRQPRFCQRQARPDNGRAMLRQSTALSTQQFLNQGPGMLPVQGRRGAAGVVLDSYRVAEDRGRWARSVAAAVGRGLGYVVGGGGLTRQGRNQLAQAGLNWQQCQNEWARGYFGERFLFGATNVAHAAARRQAFDAHAADQLAERCVREYLPQHPEVRISGRGRTKSAKIQGICFGTSLDLIRRYLRNGYEGNLPVLTQANQAGATATASANQALYDSLELNKAYYEQEERRNYIYFVLYDRWIKQMEGISRAGARCRKIAAPDFLAARKVAHWMAGGEAHRQELFNAIEENSAERSELAMRVIDQIRMFRGGLSQNPQEGIQYHHGHWQFANQEARQRFEECIFGRLESDLTTRATVRWAIALLEWMNDSVASVHNEDIRKLMQFELTHSQVNDPKESLMADLHGLAHLSTVSKMGLSTAFASNHDYLKGLAELDEGIYELGFQTGSGGHSIVFTIEQEGAFIFDPNIGTLRCLDCNDLRQQLEKLLLIYPKPEASQQTSYHSPSRLLPNHNIRIFEYRAQLPLGQ